MSKTSTWPDWNDRSVAIVASGPSAKRVDLSLLKDRFAVIAIKKSVELVPWADVVYGCDHHWWRDVRGLMNFKGLKLAYDASVCGTEYGIQKVEIPDIRGDRLLFGQTGTIGAAGNSGFQALNLALQFGAQRVALIGFDMHDRGGEHWYGRNNWNLASNPTEQNYRRWRAAFEGAADDLATLGVEVANLSPMSDLKRFRKLTIEQLVETWCLQDAA